MAARSNTSHIGTCLSMADLLAYFYGEFLRIASRGLGDNQRIIDALADVLGPAAG